MKKNIITRVIVIFTLLNAGLLAKSQDLTSIKSQIENNNLQYFKLFDKKDLSIVNLYTPDGVLLSPDAPAVRGKAALTRDFTTAFADVNIRGVQFTTTNVYGMGSTDVAEEGTWKVLGAKDEVVDTGNYLKIWRKTSSGWKIFRDIFNSEHQKK